MKVSQNIKTLICCCKAVENETKFDPKGQTNQCIEMVQKRRWREDESKKENNSFLEEKKKLSCFTFWSLTCKEEKNQLNPQDNLLTEKRDPNLFVNSLKTFKALDLNTPWWPLCSTCLCFFSLLLFKIKAYWRHCKACFLFL